MEEKEFNRQILSELAKIANEVFEALKIKEGTYTASELANNKDRNGENIVAEISHDMGNKEYEVCVNTFKCKFLAPAVFGLVWKFEQLAKVPQKDKARFTRIKKADNVVCSFSFILTKEAKSLYRLAKGDKYRDIMNNVYIDAKNSYIVSCCMGWTLNAKEIEISDFTGNLKSDILVRNKDFATLSEGVCKVEATETDYIITDEKGNIVKGTLGRFPNWKACVPKTNGLNKIVFKEPKYIYKSVKALKEGEITFSGVKGECNVKLESSKGVFTFETDVLPFDFHFRLGVENFISSCKSWDGTIFASSNHTGIIFGSDKLYLILIMPRLEQETHNMEFEFDKDGMIDYMKYGKQSGNTQTTKERILLPSLYHPDTNVVLSFIINLMSFIKEFAKIMMDLEIDRTLQRLKLLSELSRITLPYAAQENEYKEAAETDLPEKEEPLQVIHISYRSLINDIYTIPIYMYPAKDIIIQQNEVEYITGYETTKRIPGDCARREAAQITDGRIKDIFVYVQAQFVKSISIRGSTFA